MSRYILLILAAFQIACCSFPAGNAALSEDCKSARIYIGRLEKQIIVLQKRPIETDIDVMADRVLIRALKDESLSLQAKVLAYCSE